MKRYLILIFAIAITLGAWGQNEETFSRIAKYEQQNRQIMGQWNPGNRVVILGNSITELWPIRHKEFFAAYPNLIGRGISGQTTYNFLTRYREDVIDLKPKVVVINGGTNDVAENFNFAYNEEHTFGNIMTMVELAKAHKIKVILTSVLPTSQFPWNKGVQGVQLKIMRLNSRIKAYAAGQGIPYVDYYSKMVSGADCSLNPDLTTDGVHPNAAGYEVMESLLLPALRKYVKMK